MPTYQYECVACEHIFEILQSMLDKRLKKCPECGQNKLYRLIGAGSGIIFKGSGFYETDYKRKEASSEKSNTSKETSVKNSKLKGSKKTSSGKKESTPGKNQAA